MLLARFLGEGGQIALVRQVDDLAGRLAVYHPGLGVLFPEALQIEVPVEIQDEDSSHKAVRAAQGKRESVLD